MPGRSGSLQVIGALLHSICEGDRTAWDPVALAGRWWHAPFTLASCPASVLTDKS